MATSLATDTAGPANPANPARPVRLPGEQGFALARQQRAQGVTLHAGVFDALRPWAEKLKVGMPATL